MQSGHSGLKLASLANTELITKAKEAVEVTLEKGIDHYPYLADKLRSISQSQSLA
jgi:hypothetical protein